MRAVFILIVVVLNKLKLNGAAIVENFKCGFIVLVGPANAGKSTLLNQLAGSKLSIVTPKPQTTRQNIMVMKNTETYQAIFLDTPGYIAPEYQLQKFMVSSSLTAIRQSADVIAFITDEGPDNKINLELVQKIQQTDIPSVLIINKIDKIPPLKVARMEEEYKKIHNFREVFKISALNGTGVRNFLNRIVTYLPEHEPFYPKDQWTDRWERFYAAEFIREQIFHLYKEEIPYSCAVTIEEFKERETNNFIKANLYVERKSQKPIIIGKGAKAIKQLRENAQKEIEKFSGKKTILQIEVKVSPNWRNNAGAIKKLGL